MTPKSWFILFIFLIVIIFIIWFVFFLIGHMGVITDKVPHVKVNIPTG